jgi:tetratricopeptide (TPR) repeat protein
MAKKIKRIDFADVFLGGFIVLLLMVLGFRTGTLSKNVYQNMGYVFLSKGLLLSDSNKLHNPETWLMRAYSYDAGDGIVLGLGKIYLESGESKKAISMLSNNSNRDHMRHLYLAQAYTALGMEDRAIIEWRQLPLQAANHFYQLGISHENNGNYQDAAQLYKISTIIDPAFLSGYYRLAFVYWRRIHDNAKALENLHKALEYDQEYSARRLFYQGLVCYFQNRSICAMDAWKSTIDFGEPREFIYLAYEMIARLLYKDKAFTKANLDLLEKGLDEFPDQNTIYFLMARIHRELGNFDKAEKYYHAGLILRPDYAQMRFELGSLYLDQNKVEKATDELELVVAQMPENALFRYYLGLAYEENGDIGSAIREYSSVMQFGGEYSDLAEMRLTKITTP